MGVENGAFYGDILLTPESDRILVLPQELVFDIAAGADRSEALSLTIRPTQTNLAPGQYHGMILLTAPGAEAAWLSVSLRVTEGTGCASAAPGQNRALLGLIFLALADSAASSSADVSSFER